MTRHKTIKKTEVKTLKVKSVHLRSFNSHKSSLNLNNRKRVVKLLLEMFKDGDHDAFMELIELYIDHVGKSKISGMTKIPQRTIYNFKDKKHKTSSENIFKIMKAISGGKPGKDVAA